MPRFTTILRVWTGAEDEIAELIVIAGAVAVGIPLVIGLLQGARRLGLELALRALPRAAEGKVDIAAMQKKLEATLQPRSGEALAETGIPPRTGLATSPARTRRLPKANASGTSTT